MGCCLMALFGALWPRVGLVCVWLFFPAIPGKAFSTNLWPIAGFFFLPTTTLAYELIKANVGSIDNPWLIVLALALLHDLGQLRIFRGPRSARPGNTASGRARFVDPE